MKIDFSTLSKEGREIAVSTVAFAAARWAAAKALGDIGREIKAAAAHDLDAHADLENSETDERLEGETTNDQGNEPRMTFTDNCHLLAAANDELVLMADGAKWPRPQPIESVLEWLTMQNAMPVRDEDVEATRALIMAFTGGKAPSDDEIKQLTEQQAQDKATFFSGLYADNSDEIAHRVNSAIALYDRNIDRPDFDAVFNNLPERMKLALLRNVDNKIDRKCDELLTGRKRNGDTSPAGRIPVLQRGATIAVLRADQRDLAQVQKNLAHAQDPVTA
jgi:hypothetical protein